MKLLICTSGLSRGCCPAQSSVDCSDSYMPGSSVGCLQSVPQIKSHVQTGCALCAVRRSTFLGSRAIAGTLIKHNQLQARGADGRTLEEVLKTSGGVTGKVQGNGMLCGCSNSMLCMRSCLTLIMKQCDSCAMHVQGAWPTSLHYCCKHLKELLTSTASTATTPCLTGVVVPTPSEAVQYPDAGTC
jgi:hypothetical protein